MGVLTDEQWAMLEPMIEACRPHRKTQHTSLRQTIEAIVWRCQNAARWRSVPAELGPWWRAAQTFIRWGKLGVWERLLAMAQKKGMSLGMVHLDGTTIRAHAKVAGATNPQKGDLNGVDARRVRLLTGHVAAMAPTVRSAQRRRA